MTALDLDASTIAGLIVAGGDLDPADGTEPARRLQERVIAKVGPQRLDTCGQALREVALVLAASEEAS